MNMTTARPALAARFARNTFVSRDLSGATRQEFVAMYVRTRLERHIVIVSGLLPLVHVRFADDLAHATSAIESAQAVIVRWEGYRAAA